LDAKAPLDSHLTYHLISFYAKPIPMAPPHLPIASTATLHALTERLSTHSRSLHPLMNSNFANSFSPSAVAAAASAYRQPAPPPQLPGLQLAGRHQDIPNEYEDGEPVTPASDEVGVCPHGREWPYRGEHPPSSMNRTAAWPEEVWDGFLADLSTVMRKEYDVWVELCW
jgi:hypothetical protein